MKGRISRELREILGDKEGRDQLKAVLASGREGTIQSGGKRFIVTTARPLTLKEELANAAAR